MEGDFALMVVFLCHLKMFFLVKTMIIRVDFFHVFGDDSTSFLTCISTGRVFYTLFSSFWWSNEGDRMNIK